jgi:predicted HAD superfamily phosphohydrolase YqeG
MASRLGLGRIIMWAREADMEELHYVIHRVGNIAQTRARLVEQADQHNQVKKARKPRRTKLEIAAERQAANANAAGASFE